MQEKFEKIIELIQNSNLLSPQERAEWVLLLDLMNDKQLLELQRILANNKMPGEAQQTHSIYSDIGKNKMPISQISPLKLFPKQEEQKNIPPREPLHLSHILNMPNVPKGQNVRLAEEKTWEKAVEKPKNFLARLKSILAEKELPAGHLEAVNELELSAPFKKPEIIKKKSPPLVPRPPKKAAAVFPSIDFKAKEAQAPVHKAVQPYFAEEKNKPVADMLGKKASQQDSVHEKGVQISKQLAEYLTQAKAEKEQFQTLKPFNEEVKIAKIAPLPQAAPISEEEKQKISREEIKAAGKIQSLPDLARLNAENLSGKNAYLLGQIKNLVRISGYHEALSFLEKSPLFEDYLITGTQALKQGDDFSGLPLSKEEFEGFADVLRKMQAE